MITPLRIGLVDYQLEIAHAITFVQDHALRGEALLYTLAGCTATEQESGRQWAGKQKIHFFDSVEAMAGQVDAVIIPAASHPDRHLALFQQTLPLRVPVFIDKPFAQDADAALQILELSLQHNIPVSSSSSLRFSDEVRSLKGKFPTPDFVQSWGGWSARFDEFIIHPLETAMTLLGPEIRAVRRISRGDSHRIELIYDEGRRGDIYFHPSRQTYAVSAGNADGWQTRQIQSPFMERMIDQIIIGFREGRGAVPPPETLAIIKTIDAIRRSDGKEIDICWNQAEANLLEALSRPVLG